jgi:hypothetical protein
VHRPAATRAPGVRTTDLPGAWPASIDTSQGAAWDDEQQLTEDIIALAKQYGRYGDRRVTALLRHAGWTVNRKRVERIWRK